jgi:hypothetical protein
VIRHTQGFLPSAWIGFVCSHSCAICRGVLQSFSALGIFKRHLENFSHFNYQNLQNSSVVFLKGKAKADI